MTSSYLDLAHRFSSKIGAGPTPEVISDSQGDAPCAPPPLPRQISRDSAPAVEMGAKLLSEAFLVSVASGLVFYDWSNEEQEAQAAEEEHKRRHA